jgi:hypothetical protein
MAVGDLLFISHEFSAALSADALCARQAAYVPRSLSSSVAPRDGERNGDEAITRAGERALVGRGTVAARAENVKAGDAC